MRASGFVACMMAGVTVAGCSIHPLPDDLSGADTVAIANNIRCEVKHKVEERLIALMGTSRSAQIRNYHLENLKADIKKFGRPAILVRLSKLDPALALKVVKYGSIVIGYSFSFDITETNSNSANASFGLSGGKGDIVAASLRTNGKANFTRNAKRSFAITETFLDLIALDCADASFAGPNPAYPIVGSIGAGKVIDTYLSLGESGVTADNGTAGGTAGPFKDVLKFTTFVGGDITPSITLAPLPARFQLTSASGTFGATRNDVHDLTIVIPFPTIDDRLGPGFSVDRKWFDPEKYLAAVRQANKTIAYEFC